MNTGDLILVSYIEIEIVQVRHDSVVELDEKVDKFHRQLISTLFPLMQPNITTRIRIYTRIYMILHVSFRIPPYSIRSYIEICFICCLYLKYQNLF